MVDNIENAFRIALVIIFIFIVLISIIGLASRAMKKRKYRNDFICEIREALSDKKGDEDIKKLITLAFDDARERQVLTQVQSCICELLELYGRKHLRDQLSLT